MRSARIDAEIQRHRVTVLVVAERVTPYKRLQATRLTDAIPRTPSGKLLRRALIARDRQTV